MPQVPGQAEATMASSFWCQREACRRRGVCRCYLGWTDKPLARLVLVTRQLADDVGLAPIAEVIAFAAERIYDEASAQTADRYRQLWGRFGRFAAAHEIKVVGDVDGALVEAFAGARAADGRPPQPGTRRLRIAAIARLFGILRHYGLAEGDPTLDVDRPAAAASSLRALSFEEVVRCRSAALATLTTTREPALWSLAEAGGTTSEVPAVWPEHLDLDGARVWLPGSTKTDGRWADLSDWAVAQLGRRVAVLGEARPIAYEGGGSAASAQASTCMALRRIFRRAGLGADPAVRPTSVRAWLGRELRGGGAPIEEVALALGLRSLDQAAALIDLDWRPAR